ncbi:hypothetical protein [Chroococcidiopsis sp. SAG 2025]|uniref:hypothetical protein n=1 Tax=Chroococcidiopsis sp. SAG 2025 TaxID=171389 RepID=UPI0029372A89|nr:hypothetical protein [Chroococcidiopsis sp. SAG 2025]
MMPSTFRPLKRNCPICSGARRDCQENTHTGLIHCRHDVAVAPGYVFDVHGRIIGWQTRFDDAQENKYKWLSSRSGSRPNSPKRRSA